MAKVLVETSARHLHLSQQDLETLFGEGFELTFKKALSQPGQFATNEKVEVIGPKKSMGMISVIGPVRKQTHLFRIQSLLQYLWPILLSHSLHKPFYISPCSRLLCRAG